MRKNTIIIAVITLLAYLFLSETLYYISTSGIMQYGFRFDNILGVLTYSFLHVSPTHLIGNLILLIPIGIIAEKKLRHKDYFGIYFGSAIISALIFGLLVPKTFLVGASAAISGMLMVAFLVDVKKTVLAIITTTLIIFIVSPQISIYTENSLLALESQGTDLLQSLDETNKELLIAIERNDSALIENLSIQKGETETKLVGVLKKSQNINAGIAREDDTTSLPLTHLAGALSGLAYLLLFRRDIIWEMPSQVLPPRYLSKKHKRR